MQRLPLPEGTPPALEVWQLSWSAPCAPVDVHGLAPDEAARARRYRRPEDGWRFATTRRALRRLLGERLGVAPAAIAFSTGPERKPRVRNARWHFNVSHAEGVALVALSPAHAVGVDIERTRADVVTPEIESLCFTERERAVLAPLSGQARLEGFYRHWVAKEAALKALGWGIAQALLRVDISLRQDGEVGIRVDGAPPVLACEVPAPAGCYAALAWSFDADAAMPA